MSAERWGRLAADLATAGIQATVSETPYSEAVYGRVVHGVERGITLRHPEGGTVDISDAWWPKNPDVWTGWVVTRCDAGSIIRDTSRRLKKRSEVVTAVRGMLAPTVEASTP